ncbi:MAG: threonine-phosphate decarboxylase [Verrucomicrobiota bacterium]
MHQHGGNPDLDCKRLGITSGEIIDFSVNVSPLGLPPQIRVLWDRLIVENEQYPTPYGERVKTFYHSRFGLPEDCVLPGNGSIDLIYDAPRTLGIRRASIPQPSFHDYQRSCKACGAEIIHTTAGRLDGCDAYFIGNPCNPAGGLTLAEELLSLADMNPSVSFFVDEAFIQLVDEPGRYSLLQRDRLRDNIIVFHSLTKVYALPGLRVGACVSTPATIERLEAKRPPWMVSRLAEQVAGALVHCSDYEAELRRMVRAERERIYQALKQSSAYEPVPGNANYLLTQWKATEDLDDLLRSLLSQGLYVRDCRNFPTLEDNWFRIAIRRPEENDRLLEALKACKTIQA